MSPMQQIMLGVSPGGEQYWIVTDGSTDTSDELNYKFMHVDSAGNVFAFGESKDNSTSPAHYQHLALHKYNAKGDKAFHKRYRYSGNSQTARGMGALTNGQIVLGAGTSCSYPQNFLVNASDGAIQWDKNLSSGGDGSVSCVPTWGLSVAPNNDIIYNQTGSGGSNIAIMMWKLNASGTNQDDKEFGTYGGAYPRTSGHDSSSNFFLVGDHKSGGWPVGTMGWICKFNSSFQLQWNKRLGNTTGYHMNAFYAMATDSSDNIYIAGENRPSNPYYGWIIKLNSSGVIQWQKRLDHPSGVGSWVRLRAIDVDDSGNVYVGGQVDYNGRTPFWACLDSSGDFQHARYLKNTVDSAGEDHLSALKIKGDAVYFCGKWKVDSANYHGMVVKVPKDGTATGSYGPSNIFEYGSWTMTVTNTSFSMADLDNGGSDWPVNNPSATNVTINPANDYVSETPSWSEQRVAKDITG